MEGSVTLWLPEWYELKTWRHPYQRTYRPGMKARWEAYIALHIPVVVLRIRCPLSSQPKYMCMSSISLGSLHTFSHTGTLLPSLLFLIMRSFP